MHARIKPEFEEALLSEPQIATILYTISQGDKQQLQQSWQLLEQISLKVKFCMRTSYQHQMRNSNATVISKKRPLSFRVIMKSKSGYLANSVDDVKENPQITTNMNKTQSPLKNGDIKDYVKSMKNKTTNQFHKVKTTEEDIKSNRSADKSQNSLSLSRAISLNEILTQRKPKQKMSVESLEKRIDYLIGVKLSTNSSFNNSEKKQDSIDKEIADLVKTLREEPDEDGKGDKLDVINKKIGILEKVMAESITQSQLAKKSYYKYLNNRKPVKHKISSYKMDNLLKQKASLFNNSSPSSIHFESMSQLNYKAPDKKSYPIKTQKKPYQFRNQPMHRSSYDRDFLVYINIPDLPYREGPSQILPSYSVGNRNSSYQNEFTNKKAEVINFKELDCYRDKIRDIQIPFRQNARRIAEELKVSDPQIQTNMVKPNKSKRYKTEHYVKNLSTQSRVNFTGQDNKIRSFIKHKNLSDLKYAFKASVHA